MIKVHSIPTGNFHLDGGAMFGVVPKTIWEKQVPANDKNLCNWAMRCMLVQNTISGRNILIDTGIGNKQSEKFFSFYDLNGNDTLISSIESIGLSLHDITDVLLTHLHFDHVGGAITQNADSSLSLTFPNAKYYVHQHQWLHAHHPNPREKASFLPENYELLNELGVLSFLEEGDILDNCIEMQVFNGHTFGMIAPIIHADFGKVMYGADLIPSAPHIPVNYVMGYDIQPLITMEEKASVLKKLYENDIWLFFEHDAQNEMAKISKNEKGAYLAGEFGNLSTLQK